MDINTVVLNLDDEDKLLTQLQELGLELVNGLWYNQVEDKSYTILKDGRLESYDPKALRKLNDDLPTASEMEDRIPCLICGMDDCDHTREDLHKHFMIKAKHKNKMTDKIQFTDAGLRKRNVLIALELGYSFDATKPELLVGMDEYQDRPVKCIVDFRNDRKKPNPIHGVRWASYMDDEGGYLSYKEINEVPLSSKYKETRNNPDYLPEGVHHFIKIEEPDNSMVTFSIHSRDTEDWGEFDIVSYSDSQAPDQEEEKEENQEVYVDDKVDVCDPDIPIKAQTQPEKDDVPPAITESPVDEKVSLNTGVAPQLVPRGSSSSLVSGQVFQDMMTQAKTLVDSGLLPTAIKTPAAALAVMLTGHEMGIPVMQSFRSIYIINGKPTLSANLIGGLIFKHGHSYTVKESDKDKCTLVFSRNGGKGVEVTFSMDDAKQADLLKNDVWRKYPKAMLFSRCMSAGARLVLPDVIAGLYTPEELSDDVRIDPDTGEQEFYGNQKETKE